MPKRYRSSRSKRYFKRRKTAFRYYSRFKRFKRYRRPYKKKWTLKKRVKLLEGPTRKVWDIIDIDAGDGNPREYTLNWNGANITGQAMASGQVLPNLLAIQPVSQQGLIPGLSDDFQANTMNTREGNTVYVSTIEVGARLISPLPQPQYDDAVPPSTTVSVPNIQALTTCRVHFVVVRDTRCSETDNYGQAQPVIPTVNDQVGVGGEPLFLGPLEQMFKSNGQPGASAALSTLQTFGLDNALKSFKKGLRYKIHSVHSYNLSIRKAYKDIKFRIKLKRKVGFQQQRMASPGIAAQPVKGQFLVIPICNWLDNNAGLVGNDTNYNPTVTNLRARVWFRDSS